MRPAFVGADAFERELARLEARFPKRRFTYSAIRTFIGVLAYPKIFDTSSTDAALGRAAVRTDPLALVGRTLEAAA